MPEIDHSVLEGENVLWIENKSLRLGVNLGLGGAVTFLAERGRPNLINSYDWGRQVQMSFYGHPTPYAPAGKIVNEHWRGLGWNPIQSGDCYGHRSKVLEYRADGNEIYVKCVPMQWPMDDCPGECTFEVWYRLTGKRVDVTARLRNARSDTAQYPARSQELPAVYTNGAWYKLVSYVGTAPYTGAPLTELCTRENGLGYISPLLTETLDCNIVYDYAYSLLPGQLGEIRAEACALARRNRRTDFRFDENRAHFYCRNAGDQGFPTGGCLRFDCAPDAALVGPDVFIGRRDAAAVVIDGAFTTETGRLPCALAAPEYDGLFHAGERERPVRKIPFTLCADGVRRETTVDISGRDFDMLGFGFEFGAAGRAEVFGIRFV